MKEGISRKTFVRLGTLLGVGAAGTSALAACEVGAASSGSGGNAATRGHSKTSKPSPERQTIARVSAMQPGTALKFKDSGGNPAVLVRLRSGKFVAYSAVCPHQGCIVAYRNGQLACPCHGSIFDPAHNARVVMGPAQRPLLKIPVEVRDGEVVRV